jgi:hypothetical protein
MPGGNSLDGEQCSAQIDAECIEGNGTRIAGATSVGMIGPKFLLVGAGSSAATAFTRRNLKRFHIPRWGTDAS